MSQIKCEALKGKLGRASATPSGRAEFPSFGNIKGKRFHSQVYYYIVDSPRNEGKDFFEINKETGEVFTKIVFDREKQGAYALEVEARDGAPSARPNSDSQPNSGELFPLMEFFGVSPSRRGCFRIHNAARARITYGGVSGEH
jgi:hypothetical protein